MVKGMYIIVMARLHKAVVSSYVSLYKCESGCIARDSQGFGYKVIHKICVSYLSLLFACATYIRGEAGRCFVSRCKGCL